MACVNCHLLPTKPGRIETPADEIGDLVEEIESIVFWENAGFKTEWSLYPFEYQKLYAEWRNAEILIEQTRQIRLQKMFEAVPR